MNRRIVFAMVAAGLAVLPAALASHPDLLVNGGFTGGLSGWTLWGTAGFCTHLGTTTHDLTGEYHLVDLSAGHSCGIYQAVAVQTGEKYRGSVWVDVHSGTVQLHVRFVDAFGSDVGPVYADTSVGTGEQVLAAQGTAPVGATHVRFWIYSTTSLTANVHADDALLNQL